MELQWRDFLAAVLEARPLPAEQASLEDGYRAAVVCDAIPHAAEQGKRVQVKQAAPVSIGERSTG